MNELKKANKENQDDEVKEIKENSNERLLNVKRSIQTELTFPVKSGSQSDSNPLPVQNGAQVIDLITNANSKSFQFIDCFVEVEQVGDQQS